MLSKVVFAVLLTLTLGSPTPQRAENTRPSLQDADWKERLTGLNKQTQNAEVTPEAEQEVQPQPLTDPEATDHSAVKVNPEKQAVNWWEKDHSEVVAAEPAAESDQTNPAVLSAEEPILDASAPAVVGVPEPVVAAPEEVEPEVQKAVQTDVEGTWNKAPARQEKEPVETKPWWETNSTAVADAAESSSSAAPIIPEEKEEIVSGVTELSAVEKAEEEEPAAAATSAAVAATAVAAEVPDSQKVKPLTAFQSSGSVNSPVVAPNTGVNNNN